jgi:hypothetical protein
VFSEIVPPQHRTLVYAFDRLLEGVLASCAAPLVGILAEAGFGFSGDAAKTADEAHNRANARALGDAILVFTVVPWTVTFLFYSGLHCTYPKDRRVAAERARLEVEGSVEGRRLLADQ